MVAGSIWSVSFGFQTSHQRLGTIILASSIFSHSVFGYFSVLGLSFFCEAEVHLQSSTSGFQIQLSGAVQNKLSSLCIGLCKVKESRCDSDFCVSQYSLNYFQVLLFKGCSLVFVPYFVIILCKMNTLTITFHSFLVQRSLKTKSIQFSTRQKITNRNCSVCIHFTKNNYKIRNKDKRTAFE